MKTLRSLTQLRWLVLAWFTLYIGAAIASPIIQPKMTEIICSGAGMIKILVYSDDGPAELGNAGMDCPLCLLGGNAPATTHIPLPAIAAQTESPVAQKHVFAVVAMATPPPARAPPCFS